MLKRFGNSQSLGLLTLSLVLAGCIGCDSDGPKRAGTAQVHGKITLDGLPVDQAKIVFLPVELRSRTGKIMPLAFGTTNAAGEFELKYSDGVDQLIAGEYTVIISKSKKNSTMNEPGVEKWETELLPGDVRWFANFKNSDEIFPAIYNRDSILIYEVKASAEIIRPRFELSSIDPLLQDPKQDK